MTEDDLRDKLRSLEDVSLSENSKERVRNQIEQSQRVVLPGARRARRRPWSLVTGAGGVVAAALLLISVWHTVGHKGVVLEPALGQRSNGLRTESPASGKSGVNENAPAAAVTAHAVTLHPSMLRVDKVWDGQETRGQNPNVVYARLTNTSRVPVREADAFGLLMFHTSSAFSNSDLSTSAWAAFVNAPKRAVPPGQTVTWSFLPVGAPQNSHGLTGTPSLFFFETSGANQSAVAGVGAVNWPRPALDVTGVKVVPRSQWAGLQSFQVSVTLSNTARQGVSLDTSRALIWFAKPGTQGGLFDSSTVRFVDQIQPADGVQLLATGQSTTAVFRLIGPGTTDFQQWPVHVVLVTTATSKP